MRFLITAGPTREYLDPVRFISNASSGRMGIALTRAALKRGHEVTVVLGPVEARLGQKANVIRVQSTEQMARACFENFNWADCVIMAAAVADYQPAKLSTSKMKKTSGSITLKLNPTTDILSELGSRKKHQLLIGFALETENLRANALAKLKKKKLDYIIANSPVSLASKRIDPVIIRADGSAEPLGLVSKHILAGKIIRLAEAHSR